MKLKSVSGEINSVAQGSHTSGTITQRGGTISTRNVWSFRINGIPASFTSKDNLSLSDGDNIIAVGQEKRGTIQIACIKNETTGAYFTPSSTKMFILGAIILLFGIWTLKVILGIVFIFLGELIILLGFQISNANKYFNNILQSKKKNSQLLDMENHSGGSMLIHWILAGIVFLYFVYQIVLILFPPSLRHSGGGGFM